MIHFKQYTFDIIGCNFALTKEVYMYTCIYYAHVHVRLVKVFITRKANMIWKETYINQLLTKGYIEAYDCKSWATNLLFPI